jgi:hypothetical protein
MKTKHLLIAENAAAISDRVHSDQSRYGKLYARLGQQLGGFPGIWNLIAECAIELERQHPDEWEDGWIETCWSIADLILSSDEIRPVAELVCTALKLELHASTV